MTPPDTIVCVECGGVAHRVSSLSPDEAVHPGDVITYVCEDCNHRMDLAIDEPEIP